MKTRLLFLLFSLVFINTFSQSNFQEHVVIGDATSANGPTSIFSADIDGDGDMDVLTASRDDDKIAWYENTDGQGNFGMQQVISTNADLAVFVYASDIDGDGDMDVLSASHNDNKIAWYENMDGQGTFSTEQIITTNAINPRSVYASDIDGDGDMDVLSASLNDNKIAWYENMDGQGTFSTELIITTNANGAESVYTDDIDGDGDMDVLSASHGDNKIAWYENTDGQGTFGTQQVISTDELGANTVYAEDMDGDGDKDVISGSSFHFDMVGDFIKVTWFENIDGLGNFNSHSIIDLFIPIGGGNNYSLSNIYISDIDGDGDFDVISAFNQKVIWNENIDGLGNFGSESIITTDVYVTMSVYATDIDGDSDMDVLSASLYDEKVAWYENTDGLGSFGDQQIIIKSIHWLKDAFAADIDGDGDLDVLSASVFDDKIAWYKNKDGLGHFDDQQIITINADGARSVTASDLDNDGDQDVISASWGNDIIAWYENIDGQGNFSSQQIITTSFDAPLDVKSSDLDGDGDNDILSASRNDDTIAWCKNIDGQGNFSIQQVITTDADEVKEVCVADVDGDGDFDVLSASSSDDKIAWYENIDGYGNFGSQQIISIDADNAQSVYAADIDGDGDIDVLSASLDDFKIAWYENLDGNGSFSSEQIVSQYEAVPRSVRAIDLDGDNDLDIVSATDYFVSWYENIDGQGNFGSQQFIETSALGSLTADAFDFDNDGDLDILSASLYATTSSFDKLVWYENLGTISVEENVLKTHITIYPNPVDDVIYFEKQNSVTIRSVSIYNLLGEKVLNSSVSNEQLNISNLRSGIYLLRIDSSKGVISSKFLKK